ncbi:FmdB family zinc ribbon protein [Desulfohalovibrio reitneri]|uniref:FmdB family zinc ribbon protein n=1 Tax=Desulfohalovibrio reitneri TaxID=1307759 RepID=UPI0004A74816|nr:zinc ribbon domain-containing protein [Desulfohalovibrio reitneri]
MPIFEYKCAACGREFEELVFGDQAPACPDCASHDTKKLMSSCRHKHGGGSSGLDFTPPTGSGGGCSGCSGGSCSTC